jgi:hypothetical protein
MPSPERYRELITGLRETGKVYTSAKDEDERLAACRRSQQLMLHFLWSDPDVLADSSITAPLAALRSAAYDVGQGARPMLLDHPPKVEGKKPGGLVREVIQGTVLYGIDIFRRSGMSIKNAATLAATMAREQGMSAEDGSDIPEWQIVNWWKDLQRKDKKSPPLTRETFDNWLKAPFNKNIPCGLSRDNAKYYVERLFQSVELVAPRGAPKQAHRAT